MDEHVSYATVRIYLQSSSGNTGRNGGGYRTLRARPVRPDQTDWCRPSTDPSLLALSLQQPFSYSYFSKRKSDQRPSGNLALSVLTTLGNLFPVLPYKFPQVRRAILYALAGFTSRFAESPVNGARQGRFTA